jgi:hypothetical protein
LAWVHITTNKAGAVLALGGDTTESYAPNSEDYWGAGETEDEALRYMLGAVLESEEHAYGRNE